MYFDFISTFIDLGLILTDYCRESFVSADGRDSFVSPDGASLVPEDFPIDPIFDRPHEPLSNSTSPEGDAQRQLSAFAPC